MIANNQTAEDVVVSALLLLGICVNPMFWSALIAQSQELRRARAEIARLAVADERLRIARDLHDLLGHSLSLIALKSELAGRLLPDHNERATAEIRDIERVARTSLQDVREAVAGYRTRTFADEIAAARHILDAAGISLHEQIAVGDMPPDIEQMLGWLVRESVTNVIRHANASNVSISIVEQRRTIVAEIEDDGVGTPERDLHQSGSGLAGLRERTGVLGGTLVTTTLPHDPAPRRIPAQGHDPARDPESLHQPVTATVL
jgi:two-component system sensor histidine kinase DesK